MKKFIVGLLTATAFLFTVAPAQAGNLGPQNATNECQRRTFATAVSVLGASPAPQWHGATDAVYYGSGSWAIRGRWMPGGPSVSPNALWMNCRITGDDAPDGGAQNVTFYLGWPAPNYIVNMGGYWNWNYPCNYPTGCSTWNEMNRILSPFAHPDNGTPW